MQAQLKTTNHAIIFVSVIDIRVLELDRFYCTVAFSWNQRKHFANSAKDSIDLTEIQRNSSLISSSILALITFTAS